MANHKIVMKTPDRELSGADVMFVVSIDGVKRGELRLSRGDVRWRPRRTTSHEYTCTWDELAAWMEGTQGPQAVAP